MLIISVSDPWHFGTDSDAHLWLADPDLAIFVNDLQDGNLANFSLIFLLTTFLSYIYIFFPRKKVIKKSQNSGTKVFPYYFFLITEGSKAVPRTYWIDPQNLLYEHKCRYVLFIRISNRSGKFRIRQSLLRTHLKVLGYGTSALTAQFPRLWIAHPAMNTSPVNGGIKFTWL